MSSYAQSIFIYEFISLRSNGCKLNYAKLVENFANYFFKTESKNKYFIILNCTRLMLEKSLEVIQKGRPSGFSLET